MSSKGRRVVKLLVFFIELIVLVLLLGFLYIWQSLEKIGDVEADWITNTTTAEELKPKDFGINYDEDDENSSITEETVEVLRGFTNIAIFGLDNRSNGNLERGNSDVIMVASINNDTKEVRLVSVYRDTCLDTNPMGDAVFSKVNAAYAKGGAAQAVQTLNKNLDLDIQNYVTVDFKAVTDVVNLVGGVEIYIDSATLKWMNSYIRTTAEVTGETPNYLYDTGTYTLDGNQATAYCRIRYTAGNDFKRAERQREVLNAVVQKLKHADLGTLNNIINVIFPEVSTSYSNMEILQLASSMFDYDLVATTGFPFSKNTATPSKRVGDVVVACDLEANVRTLHSFMFGEENYDPSMTVKNYSQRLVELTGKGINSGDNKGAVDGTGELALDGFNDTEESTAEGTGESGN